MISPERIRYCLNPAHSSSSSWFQRPAALAGRHTWLLLEGAPGKEPCSYLCSGCRGPGTRQVFSVLVLSETREPGVRGSRRQEDWKTAERMAARQEGPTRTPPLCWGPEHGRPNGRGQDSPRVSRKVLGALGQDLCGPLQMLQAGAGRDISLSLLLLTGGAGVCTGWSGRSGPGGGRGSQEDLPGRLLPGRLKLPLPMAPWDPGPPQGPPLPPPPTGASPPSWSLGSPGAPAPSVGNWLAATGSFLFTCFTFFCLNSCRPHSRSQSQGSSLYLQSQATRAGDGQAKAGLWPAHAPLDPALPRPGYLSPESSWQASSARSISDFFISRWSSS